MRRIIPIAKMNQMAAIALWSLAAVSAVLGQSDTPLQRTASWRIPDAIQIRQELGDWAARQALSPASQETMKSLLQTTPSEIIESRPLDFVRSALEIGQPSLRDFLAITNSRSEVLSNVNQALLEVASDDKFVIAHLKLIIMVWLVEQRLYDEAIEIGEALRPGDVLDPAALLFARAVTHHQLARSQDCALTLRLLRENESKLPRRIAAMTRLMAADLEPRGDQTLDEINRLMQDIQRRQSLNRAGQKVRDQENEVIKKLDRLIEKAESQRQQMAQQQSGGAPTKPMEDSRNAGGLGTGEASRKNLPEGGDWGNLPPAQRAAALAEMTKEMPPHFRTVIEEYFRRLAQEIDR